MDCKGWRQETFVSSPEARKRVMEGLSNRTRCPINLRMWEGVYYSKPAEWGHWVLHVSDFRWRRPEDERAWMEAPFALYRVGRYPGNALQLGLPPNEMSQRMWDLWHEERARLLSTPCPVTRLKYMSEYCHSNGGHIAHEAFYAGDHETWALYGQHKLFRVSAKLDGYYKEYRREVRRRRMGLLIKVAEENLQ